MLNVDRNVAILGTGRALPETKITNDELLERMTGYEGEPENFAHWVDRVTHIQARHWTAPDVDGVQVLSYEASTKAIEAAGIDPSEIDQVILASFTFHDLYPGVHAWLTNELGIQGGSFYLTAACSGSLWGLAMARALVVSGQCRNVLVIGVECISRAMDFTDPLTAILFSDGAGAIVIGRKDDGEDTGMVNVPYLRGEFANDTIQMRNANAPPDQLQRREDDRRQDRQYIRMEGGPRVLRNAINRMADSVCRSLGYTLNDLKAGDPGLRELLRCVRLVPHQANGRILDGLGVKLGLEREQVYRTVYFLGNCSAGTNPFTLDYGIREGNLDRIPPPDGENVMGEIVECGRRIEKGDLVVLTAIGAGYLYGAIAFKQAY